MNVFCAFIAGIFAMLYVRLGGLPFLGGAVFTGIAAICISIDQLAGHVLASIYEAGRGICSEVERQTDEMMADEPDEDAEA